MSGWSKNLAHVRAVALSGAPTDILTSISAIPSDATKTATNALAVVARTNNYNDLTNKPSRIFYGTSTPSGAIAGDFWFDTN